MIRSLLLLAVVTSAIAFSSLLFTESAQAVSPSDWKPGFIISDPVFTNSNSMSVSEIQAFLNSQVPTCDTNGTKPYAGTTRAKYGKSKGNPPPFICLKDKVSSGKSAARVIYDAAKEYQINPQVIIVTLQKENSLVTDDWPWKTQYKTAMGYACPDTAPCDSEYFGFKNQVTKAAWQFRRYIDNPGGYIHRNGKTSFVRYSPHCNIGTDVLMKSAGTAALYNYTPYQPNNASLSSYPGTGNSCSAYGNRNFWYRFNDWFGSSIKGGSYDVNQSLYRRGQSLAYGDFDNDGFEDLAIGAPGEDVSSNKDAGSVNVVYGSAGGLNMSDQQLLYQGDGLLMGSAEDEDNLGTALVAGDFDNDGRDDLAIGAPGESTSGRDNAGVVNVIYGSGSGLNTADQQYLQQGDVIGGSSEAGDLFGATLTYGDYNNDGRDDLAIGAPGEGIGSTDSAGSVAVIYGSAGGLNSGSQQRLYQGSGNLDGPSEEQDYLGSSVTSGDFDGDGRDDLAIGVKGEDLKGKADAGSAKIIFGSGSGLNVADQQTLYQGSGGLDGKVEAYDFLGATITAGDYDGDGLDDLAIGAPGENVRGNKDAGHVNVIFGSGSGLNTSDQQQLYQGRGGLLNKPEKADFLSGALNSGDFNGDGRDDLAIGAPGESANKRIFAGIVNLIYGSNSGLNTAVQQYLYQGAGGLSGVLEKRDYIGTVLGAGDHNNDGRDDLAIGGPGEDLKSKKNTGVVIAINGSNSGLNESAQTDQLYQGVGGLNGSLEPKDFLGGATPTNIFW